jgi:hypothetical protein
MGALRAALIAAAALVLFKALPAAGNEPRAWGRELVIQHELPVDAVLRYAALTDPSRRSDGAPERWNVGSMWVGPPQGAGIGRNPYTLVLTVSGKARTAGDVRTHWQAGWEVRETPNATRELLMPVAALSSGSVSAGAPVTLTAAGGPVSFRGERHVAPMVNLVSASNLEIGAVTLQVWSGSPPAAWSQWPVARAGTPAAALLLAAGGWFWWRRRAQAQAADPVPFEASQRPASARVARPAEALEPDRDSVPAPIFRPSEPAPTRFAPSTAPPDPQSRQPLPPRAVPTALAPERIVTLVDVVEPEPAPPPPAAPRRTDQAARVVDALREVLTAGLAVPTELDPRRRRRSRRSSSAA